MATLATKQDMIDDGWIVQSIAGLECFVLNKGCYKMVAHNSRDGFMTRRVVNLITKALGEPYRHHQFYDPAFPGLEYPRVTTLEY